MWEFVDKVVYINLASRSDRNTHMQSMTKPFGTKVVRFDAIEEQPGLLGCARSHIGVLQLAIQENWKNVLILEDDAEWNEVETNYSKLERLAKTAFDVILLGGVCVHKADNDKLLSAQTASAYLVNQHYYTTLLENFKEGYLRLKQDYAKHPIYAIDQYWKRLQPKDTWYILSHPCMVYQKPDYSNIEQRHVDYRSAFGI